VRSLQTAYDARDKIAAINAGGSLTQQLRDALGNLVKETDPNNQNATNPVSTTYNYDPLNRLLKTVDRLSGPTTYGYDSNDRPIAITTPNGITTRYVYDDLGNLLQEQSPQRGIRAYTYDTAGNVLTLTDARGITLNYSYDVLGRVMSIDAPGFDEDITYVYDSCINGAGRLCQVMDASGTTSYAYDAFGNLTQQTHTELGITYTTSYTYDAGNRISTLTYPDGRTLTYNRDAIGRITDISMTMSGVTTSLLNSLGYRADGLIKSQTFGNGLTETRAYDLQGRLTSQNLSSVMSQTYSYDANGNLITIPSGTYGYDLLDRLVQTSLSTQNNNYTYEGNGDILNARFSVIPSSIRNDRYTYTSFGQLASYSKDNVLTASYAYNAQHQRTRKSAGSTTVYHYDLAGNLIQETDSTGTVLRSYVWLNQTPIVQIDNGTPESITYLHVDHLYTPRWGTNSTGTLVWKWEGESYGQNLPVEDVDQDGTLTTINLRFPGQYFDQESGLHYNWNRYYDPQIGRYITSDPIGLKAGSNTYAYVGNNPLSRTDPLGLFSGAHHEHMTRNAAYSECQNLANTLPRMVSSVDWEPESQKPENAYRHAMSDGTDHQSPSTAARLAELYIDSELKKCTPSGLAHALHTEQDKYADGHRGFQPWFGGTPSAGHIWGDTFGAGGGSFGEAEAGSRNLIQRFKAMCPCACQ
jgi:RHS repeat-associated protein